MVFNSYSFLLFFPIVLVLTQLAPTKWRNGLLLLASYAFYASWGKRFCVLLLGLTVLVYAAGLLLGRQKRRWLFWLGLAGTLGALLVYKYLDFGLYTVNALTRALGLGEPMPRMSLLQPAGISFFTFQAAGYLIDVYRGKYKPEKNFLRFALFVSFFPQLLSGPIGRGDQLLPQYEKPQKADFDALRRGFLVMTWGFFLKLCIADRAAVLANTVYENYESYSGIFLVFATAVYALQIYGDFAGYSYMAIGGAEMLGIHLPKNFDTPYFSQSVQEFWRRWHISLSSWFRDYVYIPLGGSRCAAWKKYRNVLIVFLVSGLWHGADATFVIWGGLNGLYQVLGEALAPAGDKACIRLGLHREKVCHKIAQGIVTFLLIDFSWIFFRAADFTQAVSVIRSIFTAANPWVLFDGSLYGCGLDRKNFTLMLLGIGLLFLADLCKRRGVALHRVLLGQDWWARIVLIAAAILALLVFGKWGPGFNQASFIYFQF